MIEPSPRFQSLKLYSEDFAIITRRGHPFDRAPNLLTFTSADHVLVSASGDSTGLVDTLLAEQGLSRRIALTVPSFFMAAASIAGSDLIGAMPRRFATEVAQHYPVEIVEPPMAINSSDIHAIVPKAAMLDGGIEWLMRAVGEACQKPA